MIVLLLDNHLPVHPVHIAQGRVFLDPHPTVHDVSEAGQTNISHLGVLEDGQGVELDKLVAAYHGKPGEDVLEGGDLISPVEQDEVSHLKWRGVVVGNNLCGLRGNAEC